MDTANGFNVERRDMKADGILMHRERNVIAVRAPQGDNATVIQVSKACVFRGSEIWLIRTNLFSMASEIS